MSESCMAYSETVEVLGNVVCDKMEPIYRNGHAAKSHWWATLYTVKRHFQVFDLFARRKTLGRKMMTIKCLERNHSTLICRIIS